MDDKLCIKANIKGTIQIYKMDKLSYYKVFVDQDLGNIRPSLKMSITAVDTSGMY